MARTPLMRSLLTLAHRTSRGEPRVTRRALVAGAGATAALGVLAPEGASHVRTQATPVTGASRIGIVGAGIAGLNAALTLHDAEHVVTLLEEVWPGVSPYYTGTATLSYPTGDPNLLGSYPIYSVGQLTSFGGHEAVPQGNVHFAGDHSTLGFTGFMEGAVRAGERAGREILEVRCDNV